MGKICERPRVLHSGNAPAFQAGVEGSIPSTRSINTLNFLLTTDTRLDILTPLLTRASSLDGSCRVKEKSI